MASLTNSPFIYIGVVNMIKYNSKINFNKIKENDILSVISRLKNEIRSCNISAADISDIINNNYSIDMCSYDIEKILLNVSICELIWYNNIYKQYKQYKNSLRKMYLYNSTIESNKAKEEECLNRFYSALTLIVMKYV